ncbi:MAG: energy-coupling factor transporter ATPase, partial [Mycoplasmoidaceae bacterium]|nr:energy-coupling factor transporter ATPase [Mycoplasmoidaceae bacterium]
MEPSIVVFDEVTSMLDPHSKQKINTLIKSLKTRFHKTIITITHDMDEALMADRIIVMNEGKIVA